MALIKHLRKWIEWLFGVWYEGPQPPPRLAKIIQLFRASHPNASADEWEAMAISFANECYRSGYTRGYEASERCFEAPSIAPDVYADRVMDGWRDTHMDDVNVITPEPPAPPTRIRGVDPRDIRSTRETKDYLLVALHNGKHHPQVIR
jgi:hypothetical protein